MIVCFLTQDYSLVLDTTYSFLLIILCLFALLPNDPVFVLIFNVFTASLYDKNVTNDRKTWQMIEKRDKRLNQLNLANCQSLQSFINYSFSLLANHQGFQDSFHPIIHASLFHIHSSFLFFLHPIHLILPLILFNHPFLFHPSWLGVSLHSSFHFLFLPF